jgi:hypothetical protein
MWEIVLGAAVSLGGTILGWYLGARTARTSAREQREWQERLTLRQREEEAAARLQEEIVELMKITPQIQMDPLAAQQPLAEAYRRLREASVRSAVLVEPGTRARMMALDSAMFVAEQDVRDLRTERVNFWPLRVALDDVHRALTAFRRGEDLPEPNFPPAEKLSQLAWPEGRTEGLAGVMRYITEQQRQRLEQRDQER